MNPCHSHSWCIAHQRARVWVGRQQGCAEMSSPHLSPTCNPSSGNQRQPKCKTSRVRNQETFEFKRAGKPMGHVHPIPRTSHSQSWQKPSLVFALTEYLYTDACKSIPCLLNSLGKKLPASEKRPNKGESPLPVLLLGSGRIRCARHPADTGQCEQSREGQLRQLLTRKGTQR